MSGQARLTLVRKMLPIVRTVIDTIEAHARACHPDEACGILLGDGHTVRIAQPAANRAADPRRHFEIDPVALIAAHRAARHGGPAVMGYFHSHPGGTSHPSPTDAALAAHDGRVWAIAGHAGVGWWRDAACGFEPLSTRLVDE